MCCHPPRRRATIHAGNLGPDQAAPAAPDPSWNPDLPAGCILRLILKSVRAGRTLWSMQLRKICTALFVLSVVAELLVVYVRQPKVSVRMGDPLQPSNILSSPAILSNTGMLPIYDVSVSC